MTTQVISDSKTAMTTTTAPRRHSHLRLLSLVAALLLVGGAVYVLYHYARHIQLNDLAAALDAASPVDVLAALGLTIISFTALAAYDWLAVRSAVAEPVPVRTALLAGATGYAVSNALGFPILTGGTVRYRIYSAAGLNLTDISRIVALSWMTLCLGIGFVTALGLAFGPAGIEQVTGIDAHLTGIFGFGGLAAIALLIVWLATGKRSLRIRNWHLPMPAGRTTVVQLAFGTIDIMASGAALWVLLPADVTPALLPFLAIYTAALTLGIASHTPGGVGVFEAAIATGLGLSGRADIAAAFILYRIIYFILPLTAAGIVLAINEVAHRHQHVANASRMVARTVGNVVPLATGTLVLLSGVLLLLSSSLPRIHHHLSDPENIVPLPFVEASHILASLIGLLLLVIARGLFARRRPAWLAALTLLSASIVFSIMQNQDWLETVVLTTFTLFLAAFPEAFYRRGTLRDLRPTVPWLGTVAALIAVAAWLGYFFSQHRAYDDDMWWQFAWNSDAPLFLRGMVAASVAIAIIAFDAALNRPLMRLKDERHIPDVVRDGLAVSSHASSALALLGDKRFLFAPSGKPGFVMYGIKGRSWIAMGDPVAGDEETRKALAWRFRELADLNDGRCVFYSIGPESLPLYLDMGLSLHKIGEVARVDLAAFSMAGTARQPLRTALNKTEREGMVFSIVPAAEVPALIDELRAVSDHWLEAKNAAEKGFSLGRFDAEFLAEFDCAVMRQNGEIVAFSNLWRSGDKSEMACDLIRYRSGVSRALMEALMTHMILHAQSEGYRWFNLGAAPLSGLPSHRLAPLWSKIGALIFRRGGEFYPFNGLRTFKDKFQPVWTPQYMACRGTLSLPQALMDVTALIAGGRLEIIRK